MSYILWGHPPFPFWDWAPSQLPPDELIHVVRCDKEDLVLWSCMLWSWLNMCSTTAGLSGCSRQMFRCSWWPIMACIVQPHLNSGLLHITLGIYRISQPIRCCDFFFRNFEKNYECILILVIYWKKTGLLHTKISNHNITYSS